MSQDQKIKTAAGKIPLDLVPLRSLQGAARVFAYGSRKYAKGNWYRATDDDFGNRYVGGMLRHLCDAQQPDGSFDFSSLASLDVESGLPEIDHMLCGLIMLRGLLIKRGALAADPGVGKDPTIPCAMPNEDLCDCRDCVRRSTLGPLDLPVVHDMTSGKCPDERHTHSWNVPLTIAKESP